MMSCNLVYAQEIYQGTASWYKTDNLKTSRKKIASDKYSVAHRTLPFGTMLKLTNVKNGNSIEAIVNDRGPFVKDRELDVSSNAAKALGFFHSGTAKILIEVLDRRK
jgi:rare lipoprotein A